MPTGSTSSDSFTWRRTKLRPQQRLSTTGNKTVVRDQNNNNNKKKSPRLFTDQSANADELQPPPAPPRAARSFCPLVADVKISYKVRIKRRPLFKIELSKRYKFVRFWSSRGPS